MNGSKALSGSTKSFTAASDDRFIQIYNDLDAYPTLQSVANALGRSLKRVVNRAAEMRRNPHPDLPALIERSLIAERNAAAQARKSEDQPTVLSPREHANRRAKTLESEVHAAMTASRYPVINPEAVVIDSHITTRYDRQSGLRYETEGTPRTWLSDTLRVEPVPDPRGRRFIFSGAQNDTPVDRPFWRNLTAYADEIGAEIIIGPWTYETSWWSENTPSSRVYDPLLKDHLCFGQMELGIDAMFCGEMNTLPTASRPISDLTTYSRGRWAIFPHAKLQLISVPASDPHDQAFQVMTTGAVTRPRVAPRKAGVKSIYHHQLGATIVEFDGDGDIFCRQILADDKGNFQDLDAVVRNGKVTTGNPIKVFVAGDIHVAKTDHTNILTTFGYDPLRDETAERSMIDILKPQTVVLHDLHDHQARNHHHADDVSHDFEMAHRDRATILDEIRIAADFLRGISRPRMNILVVESNHDIALERYVREGRYRMDGQNFRFGLAMDCAYHDWRAEVADAIEKGEKPTNFSLLEWALRNLDANRFAGVSWVYDGCSHIVDGVQLGYHGFRGANGAKGTISGFARMGHPITIGDKHSPAILDMVYCAGVMQLQQGYNKGPSGWAVSHVLQYPNGTRTLVTLQNGKWRAEM